MPNPTIALIIDKSSSMIADKYIDYALTDASTFVNIMNTSDGCSIVAFSDNASVVQPLVIIASQVTKNTITSLIEKITAYGNTNISAAIQAANGQIGTAPNPKGMILLSDGVWNRGTDPTEGLPSYPIYTIALGNNGQIPVLQQIASLTGGQYSFAPGYRELAGIYNNIANQTGVARTVTNQLGEVNPYGYQEVNTPLSANLSTGVLTVNWDNVNVIYTNNTPFGNQVNISVYDPTGNRYMGSPVFVEPGVVVFNISNPIAGNWTVGCWFAGVPGGPGLGCTWGGFTPPQGANLLIRPEQPASTGGLSFGLSMEEADGTPLENVKFRVHAESPVEQYLLEAVRNNDGWGASLPPDLRPGSHKVQVVARGFSHITNCIEQRTSSAYVYIPE